MKASSHTRHLICSMLVAIASLLTAVSGNATVWDIASFNDGASIDDSGISDATHFPYGITDWVDKYGSKSTNLFTPMSREWFWYRIGDSGKQTSFDKLPVTGSYNADSSAVTLVYTDTEGRFKATTTFQITGKSSFDYNSTLTKTITIQNLTGSVLDYHLYTYNDLDMSAVGTDNVIITKGGRAIQTNLVGQTLVQSSTLAPTHYDIDTLATNPTSLLDKLENGTDPLVLSDFAGPQPENGDVQFVFQYDLKIPANGSVSFVVTDRILSSKPLAVTSALTGGSCASYGGAATYQICFNNSTNSIAANNVKVSASFATDDQNDPDGSISFQSATGNGVYDPATKMVTWSFPSVAALAADQCVQATVGVNTVLGFTANATVVSDETYQGVAAVATPLCNYPPVVSSIAPGAKTGVKYGYQITATDADPLTFTLVSGPAGLTMDAKGLISWTPTSQQGNLSFPVQVDISDGNSTIHYNFSIYVTWQNQAPVAPASQSATAVINQACSYQIQASDPDNQALTFTTTDPLPAGLSLGANGVISGNPTAAGATVINVTVTDPARASVTTKVTINVTAAPVNQPPLVTNPGTQTSAQGAVINLAVKATDVNSDTLTYSATGLPSGLSMNASTGVISGTIAYTALATNNVTVTVTDGSAPSSISFSWSVTRTNVAPLVTNPGAQYNPQGAAVSLAVKATDANSDAMSYSATGLPAGLSINASSGVISGTIAYTALATNNVTVTVTDGTTAGTASFVWIVTQTNQAPSVTNPGAQSSAQGAAISLAVKATDANSDALSYSATGLPTGLSINASTGDISGTIAYTALATNNVTVTVTDGTASVQVSFAWSVTKTNQAPAITNPGAQADAQGAVISLAVKATDANGDALSYSATGLPAGLSINSSTGVISGTIALNALVSNNVTITVTDGTAPSTVSFAWSVTKTNQAPAITNPGAQANAQGTAINLAVKATDANGDTLSYSATGLPAGLSINSSTGVISGTIALNALATNDVTVTVTDGTAPSTVSFAWSVTKTNQAPAITNPGAQSNAQGAAINLAVKATDANGDALSYSATGLPADLSINNSTGVISGTIALNALATNDVTVTVTDGTASVQVSFAWTVTKTNQAPSVTNPGAQSNAQGAVISLAVKATDANGDALSYSATGLPAGLSINNSTGVISGTIALNAVATNDVTITVTDGTAPSTVSFAWSVSKTNQAPSITNPGAQSNAQGAAINLAVKATDANGDTLSYSATGLPAGLSINSSTGVISGTIALNALATNDVTVTVTDGSAPSTVSFAWSVTKTNQAPTITNPGAQSSAQGAAISLAVKATDANGDTLSYSATGLPAGLSINSSTGVISGTIALNALATNDVTVSVTDGSAPSTVSFAWSVTKTNQAPAITNPGAQANAQGTAISLAVKATDANGDTLSYSATGLPAGLSINSSTGVISGTIALNALATNDVTVTVTDGTAPSTVSFAWSVTKTNQAPAITNPGAQANAQGTAISLAVKATDANGDALSYSATGLPAGLSINNSTGVISGTIALNAVATNDVTITVTDGTAPSTVSFAWSVSKTNQAPSITNPGAQSNAQGASINLAVKATDANGDALNYSATGLPAGLSINSSTGVISGTIAFNALATNDVIITVTDGTAPSTVSFAWSVTKTNQAPAITNPGAQSNAQGAAINLAVKATDPNGDTLTYSATGLPTGLSINASTGAISGTIALNALATNNVTVTVTDGSAPSTVSFAWSVTKTNQAPTITNPGAQSSAQGAAISLAVKATDANGDTLSYSATGLPAGLSINSSTGVISGTIALNALSTNNVTVSVTDGTASVPVSFGWSVSKTNQAPSITNPGAQSNAQGAAINFAVKATDANGDTLTYSATGLPAGLSINSSTGVISGTIALNALATNNVTVTVTDGSTPVSVTFTWSVVALNQPPAMKAIPAATITTPAAFSYQVAATDPNGDSLTYTLSGNPTSMSISSNGLINWASSVAGTYVITVKATDTDGLSASQNFTLTVNQAPISDTLTITSTPVSVAKAGNTYTYAVKAVNSNNDPLVYSLSNAPYGMKISSNGVITWNPRIRGTYKVTVTVSNGTKSAKQSFTITVEGRYRR